MLSNSYNITLDFFGCFKGGYTRVFLRVIVLVLHVRFKEHLGTDFCGPLIPSSILEDMSW